MDEFTVEVFEHRLTNQDARSPRSDWKRYPKNKEGKHSENIFSFHVSFLEKQHRLSRDKEVFQQLPRGKSPCSILLVRALLPGFFSESSALAAD